MITYHVRPATESDLDALYELRRLAEQQLRHAGLNQWHDSLEGRRVIRRWVDRDEMNVVTTHSGDVVACFALSGADLDFWTESEADEPALYIYKIIVRPDRKGSGLGSEIIAYAHRLARQMNRDYLRLDCWKGNTGLHRHWNELGFEHYADRTAEGRNSGALFQMDLRGKLCHVGSVGKVQLTDATPQPQAGGDRYDDPVSRAWEQARDEVAEVDTHLDGEDVGARAALEQAVRALDVRAREQRQANGMTHRPYTGT